MDQVTSGALALAIIASFMLLVAGAKLATDRQTRLRGVLMIVAAAVLVTNVMIWTV
ncbi:high-affinity Fe2+/Pb2+ permease [Sphingomonas sp. F9_3S_D5_B_2]